MLGRAKPCKYCGKTTHTSLMCFEKPRKTFKQIGPVAAKWIEARKLWVKNNPPDANGYWYCYLKLPGCHVRMKYEELTVDHIKSRTRAPEQRYEQSNLAPACANCNKLKGSRDLEELK